MKKELVIDGYGTFVGIDGQLIIIRKEKEIVETMPLSHISTIILRGVHIAVSTALIAACSKRRIPVIGLDSIERPLFVLHSPKSYINDFAEKQRSFVELNWVYLSAHDLIRDKIKRQYAVIKYHTKSLRLSERMRMRVEYDIGVYTRALKSREKAAQDILLAKRLSSVREQFFLVEARASRAYWKGFSKLLSMRFVFVRRQKRHPNDPVNKLLNYAYAMLSTVVFRMLLYAGLDPSVGILHHRKGNWTPLVYDFMEPFRPLSDHAVLSFIHRQRKSLLDHHGELRRSVLKRFRAHWQNTMRCPEPWLRKKQPLERMIEKLIGDFIAELDK